MAYGSVKVDTIIFDDNGSDQNVTVSGLYRATTSGVTLSGTLTAAAVSGTTVTGTTANFTSGNFGDLNSAAATVSGSLVMTNQQQVRFREAAGNGVNYIALQAPASVASDKIITLPDVTGTVITTGDSGTVTSEMIANDTIVNADINASAAIADTKLATISTAGKIADSALPATISSSITGNAATATTLATARTIGGVSFNGSANINLPGVNTTGNQNTSGNAATATTATTATNCSRSVLAGDGITGGGALSADRTITLGTPGTLTGATANAVTSTSHTHAITVNLAAIAGTTAGPTITSSAGTNVVIPSASASAAGIVTTGTQTFAGLKTFGNINISGDILAGQTSTPQPGLGNTTVGMGYDTSLPRLSGSREDGVFLLVNRNNNGDVIELRQSGSIRGTISVTTSSTSYNTSSDYRLKENIIPLSGAIARLNQLPVHRFNFIADPDTVVDGFIAHEAAAVVPECVTGEKDEVDENGDPIYQGIDQSKVVPLLTAALQEAIAMIGALETRIAALEA